MSFSHWFRLKIKFLRVELDSLQSVWLWPWNKAFWSSLRASSVSWISGTKMVLLIVFCYDFSGICVLLFLGLLISIVGVFLLICFLVVVFTGSFCLWFSWTLIISILKSNFKFWFTSTYLNSFCFSFVFWVFLKKISSTWFEISCYSLTFCLPSIIFITIKLASLNEVNISWYFISRINCF